MNSRLKKAPAEMQVRPNLVDYEATRRSFFWESARRELSGLPGGRGINIAFEAVDRHAEGVLANRVAFRFLRLGGARGERKQAHPRPGGERGRTRTCSVLSSPRSDPSPSSRGFPEETRGCWSPIGVFTKKKSDPCEADSAPFGT